MPDLELSTGILLDQENRMLVVYRADHLQWELPGGKPTLDDEVFEAHPLRRILKQKLDIEIDTENLPELGSTSFEQGGVGYRARWHQILHYAGILAVDTSFYDEHMFVPPLARNFLRKPTSPNLRQFQRALINQQVLLHLSPQHPVQ